MLRFKNHAKGQDGKAVKDGQGYGKAAKGQCRNCGGWGHYAKDCWWKPINAFGQEEGTAEGTAEGIPGKPLKF